MTPLDVVVVGSVNADLVVGVDRHPGVGETVLGTDVATYPGGKGANQAVAAARLGANVGFVGRVGSDEAGAFLRDTLKAAAIDLGQLLTTEGPSGMALIAVGPDGDNSIIVSPGANGRLTAADVTAARPALARATVVSLQLEVPMPAVMAAARIAAECGARVVLNPSPPAPLPAGLLALCDPLILNEHEAAFLLGESPRLSGPRAAALLALGCRSVIVTLGAAGAHVAGAGFAADVPSPAVRAVDTTGAGDAFSGALAWRLARGDGLVEATRYATRAGAAAVRKSGAQSSYPTAREVE